MRYTAVHISEHSLSSDASLDVKHGKRGPKTTIKLGCACVAVVLLVNLGFLIGIPIKFHTTDDSIAIVFSGSCSKARSISFWSHLAINILSSTLFAASNNCMQYLTAPSRTEVDGVHRRRRRLDIGVHTVRNLKSISRKRLVLWTCLGLSSLPLHLLYNSAVVEAVGASSYTVLTASTEFINRGYWNSTRADCSSTYNLGVAGLDVHPAISYLQDNVDSLVRLDNDACIAAYGPEFEKNYGNVILVTNISNSDSILNLVWNEFDTEPYTSWICPQSCSTNNHTVDASDWWVPGLTASEPPDMCYSEVNHMNYFPVQYCLAQPVPESCQVGVSLLILGSVVACNAVKVFCMYWTFARLHHKSLTTVGDAIASFLDEPDMVTVGFGAMSGEHFETKRTVGSSGGYTWKGKRMFGFHAASLRRWIFCNILFLAFWISALLLLMIGNEDSDSGKLGLRALIAKGVGRLNTEYLVGLYIGTGFTSNAILANTPQLCVSLLYLLYNDLYTRIYLSKEWTSYSRTRKPLRVQEPRGSQRSTYFLSLPWKFSLPLLVTMMILHWLISQSIFLALVHAHDYGSTGITSDSELQPIGCGWSPFAIILSLVIGGCMILWLWVIGFAVQYGSRMPLVRSSSMAISAACHPPESDVDASLGPVTYGVVRGHSHDGTSIGHVSFTSAEVTPLISGERYS